MNNFENKKVSIPLAIGIFLIPLIFAWFTLGKGYSKTARMISFGWLILGFVAFSLIALPPKPGADDTIPEHPASTAEPKAEKSAEFKPEPLPAKVEANLGITPEQFRKDFNAQLKALDIESISPMAEFDIKTGVARDAFQVLFNQDIAMVGAINKDGNLREVNLLLGGTKNYEEAMRQLLILSGITTRIVSNTPEAGEELIILIGDAMDNIEKENNSHNKIIGDVNLYTHANKETGLWVIISPNADK